MRQHLALVSALIVRVTTINERLTQRQKYMLTSIRVEEDVVRLHSLSFQFLGNLLGLGQEVARNMLDPGTLLIGQQCHHLFWRRSSRSGPYFLPALRAFQEHTHGVEAGDAIGASPGNVVGRDFSKCFDILSPTPTSTYTIAVRSFTSLLKVGRCRKMPLC